MADFRVVFSSGADVVSWLDPELGNRPSRLNARTEHGHSRHVAALGDTVFISAIVAGVVAPLDAALGGRLFTAFFAEAPVFPAPLLQHPGGQSSAQHFTVDALGHYTLRLVREGGGSIFLHVDVDS